jgi:diacylglycerol kinase (ATP)
MRTVLILNPTSGSSVLASNQSAPDENEAAILADLRQYDIVPEVWYTTPDDAGGGLARRAVAEGIEMVIAAGGDGTLHEVATGLIGTNCTLAIIPLGTMNNVARSLEIPESIEKACTVIARGETRRIDVGKINGQIFLEVAGIGLEAALFPAAEEIKRYGLLSTLRGIVDGLKALFAFQPTHFRIIFDGRRSRLYRAVQISVCNTPYYGAHLRFAPRALMDDGLLDALIYTNFSKLTYIQHAISISQGQRPLEPRVTRRKIRSIYVDVVDHTAGPVVAHADGVPIGHTPVSIMVIPGALRVRVPTKVALGPNVLGERRKQTELHRRLSKPEESKSSEQREERGPSYVK